MSVESRADRTTQRLADLLANDPQFAAAFPDAAVEEALLRPDLGVRELLDVVLTAYADRPAFAERAVQLSTDPATGRNRADKLAAYSTSATYGELAERLRAVAAALGTGGALGAGDRISFLGFTGVDYTVVELAATALGAVTASLPLGVPVDRLLPIVAETESTVLAAGLDLLDTAVELASQDPTVRLLVVLDHRPEIHDDVDALAAARFALAGTQVAVQTVAELIAAGADHPMPPAPDVRGEDPALILYTSGSTGTPKGVVFTQNQIVQIWRTAPLLSRPVPGRMPWITLNNLPMGHLMARQVLHGTLAVGGTAYFPANNDMSSFLEELALVRPTAIALVPRAWDVLYQEFQDETVRRRAAGADDAGLEAQVTAELVQRLFGGRQLLAVTAAAAISTELATWLDSLLDLDLLDVYGMTEIGLITFNGRVSRPWTVDYRLIDVPELGYFGSDQPHPRGELLVKVRLPFSGYYRHPESTAEVADEDGWFRTGDIFAEPAPDQLVYVDRRNAVLKLSQGEFVAVSKLEAIFGNHPLIHQIYLYGNSTRAYLLAVVVPSERADADDKNAIAEAFQEMARTAGLQSYELPRDFLIETTPFSRHNGLLTGVGKLARRNLAEFYRSRLEELYATLSSGQAESIQQLREHGAELPTVETVTRAASALLGTTGDALQPSARFSDQGGDSLSALTFVELLNDIYAVDLPVGVVVSPVMDLQGLADYIDAERGPSTRRPSFASVHGAGSQEVSAHELTLDKFLGPELLSSGPTAEPASAVRTVLLTGATGYLGRFLVLEWLQRLAGSGGKLICLVRGKDDADARARLESVFTGGDPAFAARFAELSGHLEVVAGDKSDPWLGLTGDRWQQLAAEVDLIVDSAALVNHVLPYQQLFGPNVLGTAELIRIALTGRLTPYVFVSTVAVGQQIAPGDFTEDADIRAISPSRKLLDEYAGGYGTSKWAAEVLLREANERFGLPVSVFRSDLILAEHRYQGQVNAPDLFARLLLSLVATGVAPMSFYQLDAEGHRQRSHYDGLPVDFVAQAVSTLGARDPGGFTTFHVVNPHDDGRGLDEYVDWLTEAGHRITRVPAYDEWLDHFETALQALPDRERHASVLPLLHAYRHPWPAQRGALVPSNRFETAVRAAHLGDDREIPPVTPELIRKYITDLRYLGLLD
ncbi:carboxylic acid reductase [Kribbella sp. NPDC051770]|uniref:carboxylic acid reductase n=1 Tax=Kribbella sp. NPDC051770 TaxID=3155413 RepID=UPI00343BF3EF